MTTHDDKNGSDASRLRRHLAIMGLEDGVPEAELTAERRAMSEAKPLPLTFPKEAPQRAPAAASREAPAQTRGFGWPKLGWSAGGLLLAAGLALVVLRNQPDATPGFTVKGAGSVQVFYEQDGKVEPLASGMRLHEGAKVKAEVQAGGSAARAFWGVASKDGKLLTDAAWIWQARLDLGEGEKRQFAGSLALDGPSEGETLGVVLCPAGAVKEPLVAGVAEAIAGKPLPADLAGCRVERFPLRD
jgi:hypothetical protein